MQFAWTDGFRAKKESAQEVGEELQNLRTRYGGLVTPEVVVEHARNESSALHEFFEWDDKAAAHEHRLGQARRLIRAVVVTENGDKTPRRAFIHVDDGAVSAYMDVVDAMADDNLRLQVLNQARREMESFVRRYQELEELSEIVAVARRTVQTLAENTAS